MKPRSAATATLFHFGLDRSSPEAGAVLSEVARVRLWFTQVPQGGDHLHPGRGRRRRADAHVRGGAGFGGRHPLERDFGEPGLPGHASGVEGPGALVLLSDALHVMPAGAWMGGLAVVLLSERRWRRLTGHVSESLLPELVPAFSPVAMGAVGVLVVTGTFAAWLHLPGLDSLWGTSYGRFLVAKLALVLGALALGARNFRRLTPRLGEDVGREAMRRSASWELAVANLILLVTAVLVRTSPLGH